MNEEDITRLIKSRLAHSRRLMKAHRTLLAQHAASLSSDVPEASINALEQDIGFLAEIKDDWDDVYNNAQSLLHEARQLPHRVSNSRLPIHRLPLEILLSIFSFGAGDRTSTEYPQQLNSLTATCHFWRKSIINASTFWRYIVLDDTTIPERNIRMMIERASTYLLRSTPASVDILLHTYAPAGDKDLRRMIDLVAPHLHRCRSLTIDPPRELLLVPLPLDGSLPFLTTLHILDIESYRDFNYVTDLLEHSPRLRHLHLEHPYRYLDHNIVIPSIILPDLIVLNVHGIAHMLENLVATSLQHITIDIDGFTAFCAHSPNKLDFPNLRSVTVISRSALFNTELLDIPRHLAHVYSSYPHVVVFTYVPSCEVTKYSAPMPQAPITIYPDTFVVRIALGYVAVADDIRDICSRILEWKSYLHLQLTIGVAKEEDMAVIQKQFTSRVQILHNFRSTTAKLADEIVERKELLARKGGNF